MADLSTVTGGGDILGGGGMGGVGGGLIGGLILGSLLRNNGNLLGGHAITIVGYDNDKKIFICRNSYGEQWGDRGYFYMPYDYAELYASDAWKFDVTLTV